MNDKEFDIFFRKLYLPLGMYALRIVEDAEDAEDIVAEVFTKVWKKIEDGFEISNYKKYMYRCVRNECISFLRNRNDIVGLENMGEIDDETIDTSERDARIWKAIDDLPDKCKKVFLLSKRDGLANEEIAEELNISIKTVKNHMTKAFSRLRESLSKGQKVFFLPFL